jgi:hypothetical protein
MFRLPRNDLWVYDAGQNVWTCLQNHDDKATDRPLPCFFGDGLPIPFCYDPKRDAYWLCAADAIWRFDPKAKRWSRGAEITHRGRMAFGYHPATGMAATDGETADGGLLDLETGKIRQPVTKRAGNIFYPWGSSSASRPGSFAADDSSIFLAFGERGGGDREPLPNTWAFDAGTGVWKRLTLKASPPGRFGANLTWHGGIKAWVLFGGQGAESKPLTDTWVYASHLGAWVEAPAKDHPPGGGAMWHDEATNRVILFTGRETWALTLTPGYDAAAREPAGNTASMLTF